MDNLSVHELIEEDSKTLPNGAVLKRIRLIVDCEHGNKGTLGGRVQKYGNLGPKAWVSRSSTMREDSFLTGTCSLVKNSHMFHRAWVAGDVKLSRSSVYDDVFITGSGEITDTRMLNSSVINLQNGILKNCVVQNRCIISGKVHLTGTRKGRVSVGGTTKVIGPYILNNDSNQDKTILPSCQ
jgi:acyl-[acyl carrier protein]--UDP-N-acetylglucosamine O-acyltransferase